MTPTIAGAARAATAEKQSEPTSPLPMGSTTVGRPVADFLEDVADTNVAALLSARAGAMMDKNAGPQLMALARALARIALEIHHLSLSSPPETAD